jgi:hypothetical protein
MKWLVLCVTLAGCGFNRLGIPDGGGGACGDLTGAIGCTNTKARGYEPLGDATEFSVVSTLAPAGMKTAVVWEDADNAGGGKLRIALVDRLGAVGTPRLLGNGTEPVLLRVDNQLTLFWRDGDAFMMQRMDDDGSLLNQPRTVLTGTAGSFAIVWTGSEWAVLLSGANGDEFQIYWLRLSPEGIVVGGPTRLAQGGVNSIQPVLAWTGCELHAAWTDTRPGTPAIFHARFQPDFTRLSDDRQLSMAGVRGSFPTIAAQLVGGGVITCFQELVKAPSNHDVVCLRLDAAGEVTRREVMAVTATPSQNPHAVAHGRNMWVLWDDYIKSSQVPNVVWQFLDADGAPQLAAPANDPDIAAGGWRSRGLSTPDALYFAQFWGDPLSSAFTAQVITENCF